MERCYKIFGKIIKLNTKASKEGQILHQELSLYPEVNEPKFDIEINYVPKTELGNPISNNPSINFFSSDCMICKLGDAMVKFVFEEKEIKRIDFSIDNMSGLKGAVKKWKSIQYTSSYEAIGQIFHELIVVPMAFLFDNCTIVHSSGIVNEKNEVVLFGGTGGVGKTSLEMTLCLDHGYSFFNDDIAVIDSEGVCHPNFSYPKIYGYNLQDSTSLKKKILRRLSVLNKLNYSLHSLKGMNKVRRRIDPELFYGKIHSKSEQISSLVILFRSNTKSISLKPISAEIAAKFNSLIIETDYNVFFNHVKWHDYNASAMKKEPLITYPLLMERNTDNLVKALRGIEKIYLAHIPMEISNQDFKSQMVIELKEKGII